MTAVLARFTKIAADGSELPADATDHVVVRDNTLRFIDGTWQQLYWAVRGSEKEFKWAPAKKEAAKVDLCGWTDWRLPEVDELETLPDRSRFNPAIDLSIFPDTKSSWYWTNTKHAEYGVCAWVVSFYDGSVDSLIHSSTAFVRAVRSAAPPSQ